MFSILKPSSRYEFVAAETFINAGIRAILFFYFYRFLVVLTRFSHYCEHSAPANENIFFLAEFMNDLEELNQF